jgi:hypothetical protein
LEESKRFLENAAETDDHSRRDAYLHAALMLGFSALEAHINAMCKEFAERPELSAHEKALLLEQDVKLHNGEFKLGGLKMYRHKLTHPKSVHTVSVDTVKKRNLRDHRSHRCPVSSDLPREIPGRESWATIAADILALDGRIRGKA